MPALREYFEGLTGVDPEIKELAWEIFTHGANAMLIEVLAAGHGAEDDATLTKIALLDRMDTLSDEYMPSAPLPLDA